MHVPILSSEVNRDAIQHRIPPLAAYWVVRALIGLVQAGSYYPTTTFWEIFQSSGAVYVTSWNTGTCVRTGTYNTSPCAKSDAHIHAITLTPPSTTTAFARTVSLPDAACVVACAMQTCPGIATETGCYCSRLSDIGFCMVGDCSIQYQTATLLAQKLCGIRNGFDIPNSLAAMTDTNPPTTATNPIVFQSAQCGSS